MTRWPGVEEVGVLGAVGFEVLVVVLAVEFGDQPLRAPQRVDFVAGDDRVGLRLG